MNADYILDELKILFPNAKCELIHETPFQLLVAVVLSAQTTDAAVNKITPQLFSLYGDPYKMPNASVEYIETQIKTIGLYRNKAKSLVSLSKDIVNRFDGIVPESMKDLTSLAGVGRKSANVVRGVCFNIPSMPVDTHVNRISKRLGFAKKDDSIEKVEMKLKRKIKRDRWNEAHHLMIFFGRYHCFARNPLCENCPFQSICKKDK